MTHLLIACLVLVAPTVALVVGAGLWFGVLVTLDAVARRGW